jgi:aminopeptidase
MLNKRQLEKYADVLLWALGTARKKKLKRDETVLLRFDAAAVKLAEVLHGKLLDMGLNPVQRPGLTFTMERNFYEKANVRQLVFVPPGEQALYEGLHGSIYLHAPESLTHLSGVDPKKIGKAIVARKPLKDILDQREAAGDFSWTLCALPTEELARQARLSPEAYAAQIIRACYLDRKDPTAAWKEIYGKASAIKKWINRLDIDSLHVASPGTDLKIRVGEMRKWVGISGHNIPSFEIFVSPDWRGTEGVYYADQPSFRSGNYVEGVRLTFKRGSVAGIEASKGRAFVEKQLAMDPGARRVGEFSLTDRRFSRIDRFMANTLYDENYGGRHGNCHLAVGASYADTYAGDASILSRDMKRELGFNDSALHWDLVNTEKKTVTALLRNGKKVVLYEDGMFCF